MNNSDTRKNEIWNKIVLCYGDAIKKISNILNENPDVHFYETQDGWNPEPDRINGAFICSPMNAFELLNWMYGEGVIEVKSEKIPYIYTDDEIKDFKINKTKYDIASWKKSIEYHTETIEHYKKKIENAKLKLNEKDNEDRI